MGKFTMRMGSNGLYYFNLKANNGEIILSSEGYTTKTGCHNGISAVKYNAPYDSRYNRLTSRDGKYYFNLKAINGEIIGTSETYSTTQARENGIESVKTNAPTASVAEI